MKKLAWRLFLIFAGLFMIYVTLKQIFANRPPLPIGNILGLIILSVLLSFFSARLGYKNDQRDEKLKSILGGLSVGFVLLVTFSTYLIFKSEYPIYFGKLFLGFGLLFYGYWLLTNHQNRK